MDLHLRDNVVLVAGASRGIGLAIAESFCREGAQVIITARNAKRLKSAKSMLQSKNKDARVLAIAADMTQPSGIRKVLAEAKKSFGIPQHVIANVGKGSVKTGLDLSKEDWQDALHTNLIGSQLLTTACAKEMKGGSITYIASIAGNEVIEAPMSYGAAKAALLHSMKYLSHELGSKKIRVNAISPGNVLFEGGGWERIQKKNPKQVSKYIREEVALKRFGKADEIADAVLYLSSKRAAFITGACLVVDGGQCKSL